MLGLACFQHDDKPVIYENASVSTVTIMIDEFELTTLGPNESREYGVRKSFMPDHVRAFDEAGNLVFDRTYTWEDLEAAGWRVVITAGDIAPE